MNAPVRRALAAAAAAPLFVACNLVKLSDDIQQAQCDSDADCEVLNERDAPDFYPCDVWQCAKSRYCVKGPLDADRDGFSPATAIDGGEEQSCRVEPAEQDCDDDDHARAPHRTDICDNKDNDCDGRIDEGALDPHETDTLVALPNGAPVSASYALDPASGTVAIGFATEQGAGAAPGVVFVPEGLTDSTMPVGFANVTFAPRVAVAPLSGGRFAVAMYATSGKKRVVAGVVDSSASEVRADDPGAGAPGLACAKDEACATDPDLPTPATGGIGLAANGDHVLVAQARELEGELTCEDIWINAGTPRARVLASLLLDRREAGLAERTAIALELGTTVSPDATPVVISLGALGPGGGAAGWLVGYVNSVGELVFDRVAREADAVSVAQAGVLPTPGSSGSSSRIPGPPGNGFAAVAPPAPPVAEFAASLAPSGDGSARLGVATWAGCPGDGGGEVGAQIFELSLASDGKLAAHSVGEGTSVGDSPTGSGISIAWNEERQSWVVVWRDAAGLRARVLDADGHPLAVWAYELIAQDDRTKVLLSTGAVPLAGAWFGALAAVSHGADGPDPSFGFDVARLGACAK